MEHQPDCMIVRGRTHLQSTKVWPRDNICRNWNPFQHSPKSEFREVSEKGTSTSILFINNIDVEINSNKKIQIEKRCMIYPWIWCVHFSIVLTGTSFVVETSDTKNRVSLIVSSSPVTNNTHCIWLVQLKPPFSKKTFLGKTLTVIAGCLICQALPLLGNSLLSELKSSAALGGGFSDACDTSWRAWRACYTSWRALFRFWGPSKTAWGEASFPKVKLLVNEWYNLETWLSL